MEWKKFAKAIKEARLNSKTLYGFQVWQTVQIYDDKKVFSLNPWSVNLKSKTYGLARNLMTGKYCKVGDLKRIIENMK